MSGVLPNTEARVLLRRNRLFRTRTRPLWVFQSTACGVLGQQLCRHRSGSHILEVGFCIATVSDRNFCQFLGVLVIYSRSCGTILVCSRSLAEEDCCHSGANDLRWAGRWPCTGWPSSFWAGESPSFREGVFLYCSSDRESMFQLMERPVHAAEMSFFMDLTVASSLPLLWEDDVLCDTPQSLRNAASLVDVNCGPSSDHMMSGMAVRQNWFLRAPMSFCVVVSFFISMTSGQSVLQSTMMRNWSPPYEAKSTASCWNGLSGVGFAIRGSLAWDGRRSWQWRHPSTKCLMSWSMLGQWMVRRALACERAMHQQWRIQETGKGGSKLSSAKREDLIPREARGLNSARSAQNLRLRPLPVQ